MCSVGWGSTEGSTQMQVPALIERRERKRALEVMPHSSVVYNVCIDLIHMQTAV